MARSWCCHLILQHFWCTLGLISEMKYSYMLMYNLWVTLENHISVGSCNTKSSHWGIRKHVIFFPHFVVESNTSTSARMSGNVTDINYILSSNKHVCPSILISPVPDLSACQLTFFCTFFGAGKKNGKICDILPRCNEAVFYEMSWEKVAAERGTANTGELPCVGGGGEKGNLWGERPARVMKSSPLLIFFLLLFSLRQESWESQAYSDTLTGNWGECRPIWRLCANLK